MDAALVDIAAVGRQHAVGVGKGPRSDDLDKLVL
jgi:hypothetical protein